MLQFKLSVYVSKKGAKSVKMVLNWFKTGWDGIRAGLLGTGWKLILM
jgi:hypothetical protein